MAASDRARNDGGTATTALRVGRRRGAGRRERVSIQRYQKLEKLGEGTYGRVYKALDQKTNEHVALKLVKMDPADEGVPATTLREVSVLKTLKHETIVELKAQIYENDEFYLVFEHLEYDLKKYANREHKKRMLEQGLGSPMAPHILRRLTYDMITSVHICHCNRILHRDLKPQNFLTDPSGTKLKLCDFGLGREHGFPIKKLTHEVVTLWYRAPEVIMGGGNTNKKNNHYVYSNPIDMWSAGCVFFEMAAHTALFPGDCEIDQLYHIFRIRGTPNAQTWPDIALCPEFSRQFPRWRADSFQNVIRRGGYTNDLPEEAYDLMDKLLTYDPAKRLTARKALDHPYFDPLKQSEDWATRQHYHVGAHQRVLGEG